MLFEKFIPPEARNAYRRDALSGLLGGIFQGSVFPFIAFIARDELHTGVTLISLMVAAPWIGSMLALPYANTMEGRNKMPYVVWPILIGRVLLVLTLFAGTPLAFVLIISAIQATGGLIGPAYAAVLKEIYPDDQRGKIMAYIRVGLAFTTLVFTQLAGKILPVVGYRHIFLVAGVIGVASVLIFRSIRTAPVDPADPNNHRPSAYRFLRDTLGILKKDRGYAWFAASAFVCGFGGLMVMPLYAVFQVDELHITATQVAILSNVTSVTWMLSYPYWGKYVDVRSPLKAVLVNAFLASLVPLNYALAQNVWMLLPSAFFFGIQLAGFELSYFNGILHFAKNGKESQYQALSSFMLGIRGTLAPFLGAGIAASFAVHGISMRYVFVVAMVIMLIGGLLQMVGMRHRHEG